MATPPLAPNTLTFVERGLETLDDTGLADQDKLRIIGLISSYTLSESRMAHEAARAGAEAPAGAPQWSFQGLLRELVDAEAYPRLHRLAESPNGDPAPHDEHREFRFGLGTILDGVESLIRR